MIFYDYKRRLTPNLQGISRNLQAAYWEFIFSSKFAYMAFYYYFIYIYFIILLT